MFKDINTETYNKEVRNISEGMHLVVFHAVWCPPCRKFKEELQKLSEVDGINVYRLDVDEEKELAQEMKVVSLPTWFVYKNGKLVKRALGYVSYEELKASIEKYR